MKNVRSSLSVDLGLPTQCDLAWGQPLTTAQQTVETVVAGWQGVGSKDGAYFTLEKSAAILASFPS